MESLPSGGHGQDVFNEDLLGICRGSAMLGRAQTFEVPSSIESIKAIG